MKKMFVTLTLTALILFVLLGGIAFAGCPDFKVVCKDGTCHGWYDTCWSWKDFMCMPCSSDFATVCSNHQGPDCVWFKSLFEDLLIGVICKYLHMPNCITCAAQKVQSCY